MTERVLTRKKQLRNKRKFRVRRSIFGISSRPRLSIFKSNRYLYAQVIDDEKQITLDSVNGSKERLGKNQADAVRIGEIFSASLKDKGITRVVLDRNGYLYHGVIAAFAQSLRKNGISL